MQNQIPFARLPLPKNPKPQKVSYARLRDVFERFRTDLEKAEKTLSQVQDTKVKLRLDLDEIRLDLNGDGTADAEETLQKFYTQYLGNLKVKQVTFDLADVHWLRGYCHLLMAMDEVILAYDWQPLFQNVGHLFFAKVDTPFKHTDKYEWILDEITFIHLLNFPVKEPQRMKKALGHLESVIQQSRLSWKKIQTEMDDDREWIPGPKQTGAININVTEDMVKGWHEFLDEAEAMLAGKKLVPHWRIRDGRGINLRKVFTHPARFDLVLYVHGSGVYPFLEKGPITDPNLWNRLQTVFRGQFIGFAFWFN